MMPLKWNRVPRSSLVWINYGSVTVIQTRDYIMSTKWHRNCPENEQHPKLGDGCSCCSRRVNYAFHPLTEQLQIDNWKLSSFAFSVSPVSGVFESVRIQHRRVVRAWGNHPTNHLNYQNRRNEMLKPMMRNWSALTAEGLKVKYRKTKPTGLCHHNRYGRPGRLAVRLLVNREIIMTPLRILYSLLLFA